MPSAHPFAHAHDALLQLHCALVNLRIARRTPPHQRVRPPSGPSMAVEAAIEGLVEVLGGRGVDEYVGGRAR